MSQTLILGLGLSGTATAEFLLNRSESVAAFDSKAPSLDLERLKKKGLSVCSDQETFDWTPISKVIASPGFPPSHPIYQEALKRKLEVIGEAELAFQNLTNPTIGITGTNGKTTVTLLTAHVLNFCGMQARAVGNIGQPLISLVDRISPDTILVTELSSWQLETLQSQVLDVAVVLNITPDHLDRHGTMEDYAQAKFRIGLCLKPQGTWYVHASVFEAFYGLLKRYHKPAFYEAVGTHDDENERAAFLLCQHFGVTQQQFNKAIKTFQKPHYRNQLIRIHHGVRYYNDSKGTNIDAVIKAVNSVEGKCILIAGGRDKGSSFAQWIDPFKGRVCLICAIGEAAAKIQRELSSHIPVQTFPTLEEATHYASLQAATGDNVILSPGCSSFDMFDNYEHRGREFDRIVLGL